MENITEEQKEIIKKERKKKILLILLLTVPFFLGGLLANFTKFKYSLPLGIFFMYATIFFVSVSVLISNFKNKKTKLIKKICIFIVMLILVLLTGHKVFGAIYDLIVGPKEIVLTDTEIILKKRRQRYGYTYLKYLQGETKGGYSKEIFIRGKERQEYVKEILNKDDEVRVYYFKGINELYTIESTY